MNVEICPKMIPKDHIFISIYPIPVHPSPVSEVGLTGAKCPQNETEKRQKTGILLYTSVTAQRSV